MEQHSHCTRLARLAVRANRSRLLMLCHVADPRPWILVDYQVAGVRPLVISHPAASPRPVACHVSEQAYIASTALPQSSPRLSVKCSQHHADCLYASSTQGCQRPWRSTAIDFIFVPATPSPVACRSRTCTRRPAGGLFVTEAGSLQRSEDRQGLGTACLRERRVIFRSGRQVRFFQSSLIRCIRSAHVLDVGPRP